MDKESVDIFKILAGITGLLALIQSYRAFRLSKKIAHIQGSLKSTDLKVCLYTDLPFDSFIIAAPMKNRIIEFPLAYAMVNTGEKTAKNVDFHIRTNKLLFYDGQMKLEFNGPPDIKLKHQLITQSEDTASLIINIESLHPHVNLSLPISIVLGPVNIFKINTSVDFMDVKNVPVESWFELPIIIDYFLLQEDHLPITKRAFLYFIDTSENNAEQLLREYNDFMYQRDKGSLKNHPYKFEQIKDNLKILGYGALDKSKLNISDNDNVNFGLIIIEEKDLIEKRSIKTRDKRLKYCKVSDKELKMYFGGKRDHGFIFPGKNVSLTKEVS